MNRLNALSEAIHGTPMLPLYRPPSIYTGEAFGVEYLYQQSGKVFKPGDLDKEIDEGFGDMDEADEFSLRLDVSDDPTIAVAPPSDGDNEETDSGNSGMPEDEVSIHILTHIQYHLHFCCVGSRLP